MSNAPLLRQPLPVRIGRRLFAWVTLGVAASVAASCAADEGAARKPNIVVFVLDTMRADYFSFHGHERELAPNLARLAAESAVFEDACSVSSWTAPATASLLTGVYPDRHGVTRGFLVQIKAAADKAGAGGAATEEIKLTRLSQKTKTLPEVLGARGYSTFGFATNINIGPEIGFDRGFGTFERSDDLPAEQVFERIKGWKPALESGDPYLLYIHLNDVHKPYQRRDPWYTARGGVPEAEHYESEVGYMDEWIGRVLAELDPDDDTLIAVVSDHGEEFMEHGNIGHHMSLHPEVNRMVMMLKGPGLGIRPAQHRAPVSGIDFAPTLLDLIGMPAAADAVDGISLAPILRAAADANALEAELEARPRIAHRRGPDDFNMYAVIARGWKYIQSPRGRALFDMTSDPGEHDNVIDAHTERRNALMRELDVYRARDYDPGTDGDEDVPWDPDLVETLQNLGYVEVSDPNAGN